MTLERLNDAPILDQLEGHWQKISALLMQRFSKRGEVVVITADEIGKLNDDWPDGAILLVGGHVDSITLKLVTPAEAQRAIEYDKTMQGRG
jgi:hypothetical protein